jgi:hypothetical protein
MQSTFHDCQFSLIKILVMFSDNISLHGLGQGTHYIYESQQ